jgi:hypothetical protein
MVEFARGIANSEAVNQIASVLALRMFNKPGILLRSEGCAALAVSLIFYRELHFSWLLFAILLLAPDLSMIGYLGGVRIGASVYNIVHTLVGPLLLIGFAVLTARFSLLVYGLIWTAHIGMDRMLGFGLKYPTNFRDKHLQHVL